MNYRLWSSSLTALSLAFGATLQAQEKNPDRGAVVEAAKHAVHGRAAEFPIDTILGADVRLAPSATAKQEADEKNETAKAPTAEVTNLVMCIGNSEQACVSHAIVSVGGLLGIGDHEVCIPIDKLEHGVDADGEPTFSLHMTKAELKKLPAFDAAKAEKHGVEVAIRAANDAAKAAEAQSESANAKAAEASAERAAADEHMVLAAHVAHAKVWSKDGEFGKVHTWFANLKSDEVEFVAVSHGGVAGIGDTVFLVPLAACEIVEKDGACNLRIAKSTKELEQAGVRYVDPDGKAFIDDAAATRAHAFYGTSTDGGRDLKESAKNAEQRMKGATASKDSN